MCAQYKPGFLLSQLHRAPSSHPAARGLPRRYHYHWVSDYPFTALSDYFYPALSARAFLSDKEHQLLMASYSWLVLLRSGQILDHFAPVSKAPFAPGT
jgi:hypothetical protein